jgi:(Z)-2-((N-methylformamido)methylene)-5-hydroxybutyrolactone dehydrogenase
MTPAQPAQLEELKLFIHGTSVDACSGRTSESQDPSTGTAWARLAAGGPEDIDEAVA